ncbi:MAG: signal transduction histidine kinase [Verrucomicrobiales bacterium]
MFDTLLGGVWEGVGMKIRSVCCYSLLLASALVMAQDVETAESAVAKDPFVKGVAVDDPFGDAGGVEADAPTCSLRVSDRGPGIPETAAKRIFEPFVRLSERVDEGVSGTGLGLSIARELAEKMGGALLLLESESGAVFEFRLPVAPSNVVEMEGRKIS